MDFVKKFKGYGLYISPELFNSRAWNDIGIYAHRLFFELHNGLRYKRTKKNDTEFTNHDELSFTQVQFCDKYGCVNDTYTNARNRLIYVGLARITHKGGNGRGDYTKYKLCYMNNVPLPNDDQARWRSYDDENKNWGHEIPTSKHRIGINHRFEKGECGRHRKKKPTLSKPPLYEVNPPMGIDSKNDVGAITPLSESPLNVVKNGSKPVE